MTQIIPPSIDELLAVMDEFQTKQEVEGHTSTQLMDLWKVSKHHCMKVLRAAVGEGLMVAFHAPRQCFNGIIKSHVVYMVTEKGKRKLKKKS